MTVCYSQVNLPREIRKQFRHTAVIFEAREDLRVIVTFGGGEEFNGYGDGHDSSQLTVLIFSKCHACRVCITTLRIHKEHSRMAQTT